MYHIVESFCAVNFYLKHPPNILDIVDMLVHIQITPFWLPEIKPSISKIIFPWEEEIRVIGLTCKPEMIYFALSSNFSIFSGMSSLIACCSMNHGEISALTSSGIFDRRLVCWFIITHVLNDQEILSTNMKMLNPSEDKKMIFWASPCCTSENKSCGMTSKQPVPPHAIFSWCSNPCVYFHYFTPYIQ